MIVETLMALLKFSLLLALMILPLFKKRKAVKRSNEIGNYSVSENGLVPNRKAITTDETLPPKHNHHHHHLS